MRGVGEGRSFILVKKRGKGKGERGKGKGGGYGVVMIGREGICMSQMQKRGGGAYSWYVCMGRFFLNGVRAYEMATYMIIIDQDRDKGGGGGFWWMWESICILKKGRVFLLVGWRSRRCFQWLLCSLSNFEQADKIAMRDNQTFFAPSTVLINLFII